MRRSGTGPGPSRKPKGRPGEKSPGVWYTIAASPVSRLEELLIMSPRRDPRRLLRQATTLLGLLGLLAVGCIFSPNKDEGGGGNNTSCKTATNQSELIVQLRDAYQRRDYDCFANLFSTEDDGAPYTFWLNEPLGESWGLTEELRIHRRMFKPEDPLPGETPVAPDLWLASITIQLEPQTEWTERPDLYVSEANPTGLDPARWVVTEAQFNAYVFFETQGETDYQVNGRANFVVVEDLTKTSGTDRKFLVYRWEDLGSIDKPAPPAI